MPARVIAANPKVGARRGRLLGLRGALRHPFTGFGDNG